MQLFSPVMVLRHGTNSNGTINYCYDPAGNRESKSNTFDGQGTDYYVRDAQGNTLAVYKIAPNSAGTFWREQHLYGSSRLGIWKPNINITSSGTGAWKLAGLKQYELTNHLGNVLAVVSDKRRGVDTNADGIIDYYNPDVLSAQDYYPGGMPQPGRSFPLDGSKPYRFGYQGSEKDDDINGKGNYFTTEFREGDTRLMRWWSTDPKADLQPWQSPYNYMDGNPIKNNDPDGDLPLPVIGFLVGAGVDYGFQVAGNFMSGKSFKQSFTAIDGNQILISGVAGALSGGLSALGGSTTQFAISTSIDIGESIAKQINNKKPVTASQTFSDVISAKVGGAIAKKIGGTFGIKTAERQLSRAERVSAGDPLSSGRATAVTAARATLNAKKGVKQAAGAVAGNEVQNVSNDLRNGGPANAGLPPFIIQQDNTKYKPSVLR